ncbi:MAG TPA: hypothetical protein VIY86_12975, partial [Pirellulaceae bacterium]
LGPACERLRGRLDLLANRLRSIPANSHAFYARTRIDDETLEDLYEYDLWMIDESTRLAQEIKSIVSTASDETLRKLSDHVSSLETKWSDRQQLIEREP